MLPLQRRVFVSAGRIARRTAASYATQPPSDTAAPGTPAPTAADQQRASQQPTSSPQSELTGAAKLFADAANEESPKQSRDHPVFEQGPVWTGDESTQDAVLRMLVDAHKPLRTGEGISHDSADKRVKQWMKNLDMSPRSNVTPKSEPIQNAQTDATKADENTDMMNELLHPHRTKIPPHLHRPWHSTYTGEKAAAAAVPQIKYGNIEKQEVNYEKLFSDLELRLKPDADGTAKQKVRELKSSIRLQGRVGGARESAIDYRLGIADGDMTNVGSPDENIESDDTFKGNRQIRGMSVLGGRRGVGSGVRAWAGLVEERIQGAKDSGMFQNLPGRGAPIISDEAEKNPSLGLSEVFMNRIIKRNDALPPWIELQKQVEQSTRSFRELLLDSYTRHLVRTVLSTNAINPLPPLHSIPDHDEAWEARELKFHTESIKQINELTRKMNTLAPFQARRGVLNLEYELKRIRGTVLRDNVWDAVKKRREEILDLEARGPPQRRSFLSGQLDGKIGNGILGRLGRALDQPRDSAPVGGSGGFALMPGGTVSGGNSQQGGGGMGLLIFAGVGVGVVLFFRRPVEADAAPEPDWAPLIPLVEPPEPEHSEFVASSPAEPKWSAIEFVRQYVLEPILTVVRFLHLALLFGPVILTAPMLMVGSQGRRRRNPVADPEENWGAVWWYGFLVKQMERAGPSFIKLAQWAASRADLFPATLCELMSKLHSSNDPHSFRYTKRVIEKSFGHKFEDIFDEFDETPIGCGAIAQVYKAKLRPEILVGSEEELKRLREDMANQQDSDKRIVTSVAVKVLHPRVDKLVRRDIAIMSIFANIINAFPGMQWISLPEEVLVFGDMMSQQLDLRVEGANLDRFEANFRHRGKIIAFPKAIRIHGTPAATRKVLIEEYEDALPLKYFLSNGGGPYDEQIADFGLDAFLEMLLLDNWTHGDLHPGNIMVRFIKPETHHVIGPLLDRMKGKEAPPALPIPMESASAVELVHELKGLAHNKEKWLERLDQLQTEGYVPQLIFIDAGLVTSLNEKNRRDFLDLFQAIAEFDGYRAGKLMVERCRHPELAIDEETFALKIQHLVLSVKSKTFSLAKIKISDILADVLTAVRQHHVKLEGDFVNTVISVLLLEGIGRQLDPEMDLFKSALPILRQVGRQMSTRDAMQHVESGNIWAMAKLWIWAEARSMVGAASMIDTWVKYDWLAPNI